MIVFYPNDHWPKSEGLTITEGEKIYACKYAFAMLLQPQSILELGVRCGYSAQSFLAAVPKAYYLGIDLDMMDHGGLPGSFGWTLNTLTELFPDADINMLMQDINSLNKEELGNFDLIHVDSDHSEEGCLNHLRLAASIGKWVLVDDFYHLNSVKKAVVRFLEETKLPGMLFPTFRGDVLINCQ